MRVFRHWALGSAEGASGALSKRKYGNPVGADVWGGSDAGPEEALRAGQARARQVLADIQAGRAELHEYGYERSSRPEPLIEDLLDADGVRMAAITINQYGALVLNTRDVVFVDVDATVKYVPMPGFWNRLRGRWEERSSMDAQRTALHSFVRERPGVGVRVYETAGGLRYLLTSERLDPTAEETATLLDSLMADRLYTSLCRHQRSFRARLTPKPWRMDLVVPHHIHAERWANDAALRAWHEQYRRQSTAYGVCRLREVMGPEPRDPDILRVLELHDRWTCGDESLPLA